MNPTAAHQSHQLRILTAPKPAKPKAQVKPKTHPNKRCLEAEVWKCGEQWAQWHFAIVLASGLRDLREFENSPLRLAALKVFLAWFDCALYVAYKVIFGFRAIYGSTLNS